MRAQLGAAKAMRAQLGASMNIRRAAAVVILVGGLWLAPAMSACITVGVYQDNPAASLAALDARASAPGSRVISTYLTAGQPLAQSVIKPPTGTHAACSSPGSRTPAAMAPQPGYRLKDVARRPLRRLAEGTGCAAARFTRGGDPAPDAGDEHALVRVVRDRQRQHASRSTSAPGSTSAGGPHRRPAAPQIKLLWAPYAWSIPDSAANQLRAYFPGASRGRPRRRERLQLRRRSRRSAGASRGSCSHRRTGDRVARRQAVLACRDRLDGGRRRSGRLDSRRSRRCRRRRCRSSPAIVWYDVNGPDR